MREPDLGDAARVVAQQHGLADTGRERRIDVAHTLEAHAVRCGAASTGCCFIRCSTASISLLTLFEKHRPSACAGAGPAHQQRRARFRAAPSDQSGRASAARGLLLPPIRRAPFLGRRPRRLVGRNRFSRNARHRFSARPPRGLVAAGPAHQALSVGVVLLDLVPAAQHQPDLFAADNHRRQKLSPLITISRLTAGGGHDRAAPPLGSTRKSPA